jgi:hypothetical protein
LGANAVTLAGPASVLLTPNVTSGVDPGLRPPVIVQLNAHH